MFKFNSENTTTYLKPMTHLYTPMKTSGSVHKWLKVDNKGTDRKCVIIYVHYFNPLVLCYLVNSEHKAATWLLEAFTYQLTIQI